MIGALATKWAQLLISQPTVACPTQRGCRSNDELNKWESMQVGAMGIVVRTESSKWAFVRGTQMIGQIVFNDLRLAEEKEGRLLVIPRGCST